MRQWGNVLSKLHKCTTIKAFSQTGEGVERTARRMRGTQQSIYAEKCTHQKGFSLRRGSCRPRSGRYHDYNKEPVRAAHILFLRQKLSPRAPLFLRRTPLTARFCPPGAFRASARRSHSPRQTPLHGVTNHAKSQDVVKNTNIIKTSRKNVHFRKKIQKNLKKLQKRC